MSEPDIAKKLDRISLLLTLNLICMLLAAGGLIGGLLPAMLRIGKTTERVEQRFQEFANEVQPVVASGAGKAIETIMKVDADRLSDTATESSDALIKAAGDRAKRYLEEKKK